MNLCYQAHSPRLATRTVDPHTEPNAPPRSAHSAAPSLNSSNLQVPAKREAAYRSARASSPRYAASRASESPRRSAPSDVFESNLKPALVLRGYHEWQSARRVTYWATRQSPGARRRPPCRSRAVVLSQSSCHRRWRPCDRWWASYCSQQSWMQATWMA
jgi:hypothetical protein